MERCRSDGKDGRSFPRFRGVLPPARGIFLIFVSLPLASAAGELSFSRDVKPILSNKCYFCHGPDSEKREAGLRLDSFEGATAPIEDSPGRAVVPGDPESSLMIQRMRSGDPDVVMPPPKSHLKMTPEEIGILERWIKGGAKYEKHWAFTDLPALVPVPAAPAGQRRSRSSENRWR